MKKFLILFACFAATLATTQSIIKNTKSSGIIGDIAGDYCEWDGAKVFPGAISIFQRGRCRQLECTTDFDLHITMCSHDVTGRIIWVNPDLNAPYPQCCGVQKDTWMAAERV